MKSEAEIEINKKLKYEGKKFKEIADIVKIYRHVVIHLYYYDRQILKKKRGHQLKLMNFEKLKIKRKIFKENKANLNATKVKKSFY